jgi:hypothetical protein
MIDQIMKKNCKRTNIHLGKDRLWEALLEFPSIQFGIEMAFQSLVSETPFLLFPSAFTDGSKSMVINGLVWMGEEEAQQIEEKIRRGLYLCKTKIGAIDFDQELRLCALFENISVRNKSKFG